MGAVYGWGEKEGWEGEIIDKSEVEVTREIVCECECLCECV